MNTWDRLCEILRERVDDVPQSISETTRLDDLHIDSLQMIDFFFAVEGQWQIAIDPTTPIDTLGDLRSLIDAMLGR